MIRFLAITTAATGYAYALIFGAVAGLANPFMEQPGDCRRACEEARSLLQHNDFPVGFCAIALMATIAIGYLMFDALRRNRRRSFQR